MLGLPRLLSTSVWNTARHFILKVKIVLILDNLTVTIYNDKTVLKYMTSLRLSYLLLEDDLIGKGFPESQVI